MLLIPRLVIGGEPDDAMVVEVEHNRECVPRRREVGNDPCGELTSRPNVDKVVQISSFFDEVRRRLSDTR